MVSGRGGTCPVATFSSLYGPQLMAEGPGWPTTQHTGACTGFSTGSPMSWDMPLVLGTWGQLVTLCTPQRVVATSFAHPESGTQGPRQMAVQALGSWYANVTALQF